MNTDLAHQQVYPVFLHILPGRSITSCCKVFGEVNQRLLGCVFQQSVNASFTLSYDYSFAIAMLARAGTT